jgi:catechol 2,3-dioxygenase-like lactoylglutathione lyase family enzyme
MIGYVTLGTNDIDKARSFYDELLREIGAGRISDNGYMTIWGHEPGVGMLAVVKPNNKEEATIGNGSMVAIAVKSKDLVEQLHTRALSLGASNEGDPGPRGTRKTEFAYCRDPEGHKLAFFCMNG